MVFLQPRRSNEDQRHLNRRAIGLTPDATQAVRLAEHVATGGPALGEETAARAAAGLGGLEAGAVTGEGVRRGREVLLKARRGAGAGRSTARSRGVVLIGAVAASGDLTSLLTVRPLLAALEGVVSGVLADAAGGQAAESLGVAGFEAATRASS